MKKILKNILPAYVLTFVFAFMLFCYEPIYMYITNMCDFWFDIQTMIKPILIIFCSLFLAGSLIFTLLYFLYSKVFKNKDMFNIVLIGIFFIFIMMYIQGNFLVSHLPPLDGSTINWGGHTIDNVTTLIIGIVLMLILIIMSIKLKLEKVVKILTFVSLAIFAMLSVSLVSTIATTEDALKQKNSIYLSKDGYNTISTDKNFIIFLVDSVDSGTFEKIIDENENYKKVFNDFTYYKDALSMYPLTRDTVPSILSGTEFKNQQNFIQYSSESLNNSKLFNNLKNRDYKISLYDEEMIWNGQKNFEIENNLQLRNIKIAYKSFLFQELKYDMFKYLPYKLKKYSKIETLDYNKCFKIDNCEKFTWNDYSNYHAILDNPTLQKEDKKMFKFVHVEGAHVPFNYDKDINLLPYYGTYEDKIKATIKLIDVYISRLKENDVYDNSAIIIMADHGDSACNQSVEAYLQRFNPIFFVKGVNEKHNSLKKSDLPISYFDLNDLYSDLLDGKKDKELFTNIPQHRRRRFLLSTYKYEDHLVEYETYGSAKDIQSYKKTGNVYDR